MSTSTISARNLRTGLMILALLAGAMILLPWNSYPMEMVRRIEWRTVAGYSTPYGPLAATMLVTGLGTSMLEMLLRRSARFVHMGLFAATLLVGVMVHTLQLLPGSMTMKVRPEFDVFLALALLTFATAAMLSPARDP